MLSVASLSQNDWNRVKKISLVILASFELPVVCEPAITSFGSAAAMLGVSTMQLLDVVAELARLSAPRDQHTKLCMGVQMTCQPADKFGMQQAGNFSCHQPSTFAVDSNP